MYIFNFLTRISLLQ